MFKKKTVICGDDFSRKSFNDNQMQEYPSIIRSSKNQYILYNGNNYGKYGINFAFKKEHLR